MDLPNEGHQDEMCWKFKKAVYGTRDAAQNLGLGYAEMMVEAGIHTRII